MYTSCDWGLVAEAPMRTSACADLPLNHASLDILNSQAGPRHVFCERSPPGVVPGWVRRWEGTTGYIPTWATDTFGLYTL